MRFKNVEKVSLEYVTLTIPRIHSESFTVQVFALPLGLTRDFEGICPTPVPPKTNIVSKSGNESKANYEDPAFRNEFTDHEDLRTYYTIYRCLVPSAEVDFNNKPTDIVSMQALREEIKQSGLSDGDVRLILQSAVSAGSITKEDIEAAKANLSASLPKPE